MTKRRKATDPRDRFIRVLQGAIQADDRTLYGVARDSGLRYGVVHAFARGTRENITLRTAAALAATLGLELRPTGRKGR